MDTPEEMFFDYLIKKGSLFSKCNVQKYVSSGIPRLWATIAAMTTTKHL